jgi:putative spermidine/putrescine transport system permease protein
VNIRRRTIAIDARTRSGPGRLALAGLLAPALAVVVVLFGGGLVLGLVQSFGYLPAAGMTAVTLAHFRNVVFDPDFLTSLGLTFYVSLTATVIAAAVSLALTMAAMSARRARPMLDFVFQVPLTVPHLVIATAVVFLLAPTGLVSRFAQVVGFIDGSSQFPLLINDPGCIGIIVTYVWKEVPFITLMLLAAIKGMGTELLEVGKTLHAAPWQRFRYIVLPVLFPSLGAACLIVFAYTFGAFEVPYLLGQTHPMTLSVSAYRSYSDIDLMARPEGIATGIVIALVVVICVVLSQLLTQLARRRGVIL